MSLYTLGLNHHTAPLGVRERVVFHVERMGEALAEAKRLLAPEAAILSTCNRTEIYLSGELDADKRGAATRWLADALPDARFHQIARAAHAAFISHVDEVAQCMRQFLGGPEQAAGAGAAP